MLFSRTAGVRSQYPTFLFFFPKTHNSERFNGKEKLCKWGLFHRRNIKSIEIYSMKNERSIVILDYPIRLWRHVLNCTYSLNQTSNSIRGSRWVIVLAERFEKEFIVGQSQMKMDNNNCKISKLIIFIECRELRVLWRKFICNTWKMKFRSTFYIESFDLYITKVQSDTVVTWRHVNRCNLCS